MFGWFAPPKFTRAWEPTLLWNHYTHPPATFKRFRCEPNRKKSKSEREGLFSSASPSQIEKGQSGGNPGKWNASVRVDKPIRSTPRVGARLSHERGHVMGSRRCLPQTARIGPLLPGEGPLHHCSGRGVHGLDFLTLADNNHVPRAIRIRC